MIWDAIFSLWSYDGGLFQFAVIWFNRWSAGQYSPPSYKEFLLPQLATRDKVRLAAVHVLNYLELYFFAKIGVKG